MYIKVIQLCYPKCLETRRPIVEKRGEFAWSRAPIIVEFFVARSDDDNKKPQLESTYLLWL